MECNAILAIDKTSKLRNWGGARANSGGPRPNSGRPRITPAKPAEPSPTPLGVRWYVAVTHPHSERQSAVDLTRQGWRTYLPLTAVWRRDRALHTMVHKVILPLIGGLVFVAFDRDERTWGCIREHNAGIRDIMRGPGGRPCPLPDRDIEKLMREDKDRLKLKTVNLANPPHDVGALVRTQPHGFAGVVRSCDGLTTEVDVEAFGRTVPMQVGWDQVEVLL